MNTRNLLSAVALFALAAGASAALSPEKAEWGNGPVQFLMTKEEAAQWKALQTDADADAFIAVFWARRGGANAKADQEARWKYADEKFSAGGTKGSMSDRGRTLTLFGVPTKVLRSGGDPGVSQAPRPPSINRDTTIADAVVDSKAIQQLWVYEGDAAQKIFGQPKVEIRFIDARNKGDFKMDPPKFDYGTAAQGSVAAMITRPEIVTAADINKPGQPVAPAVPPPPAPPSVKTAAYVAAIDAAKGGKGVGSGMITSAELVSPTGDYYAPVMLFVPRSSGIAADAADTVFWAVDDANGKRIAAGEEPAK